VAIELDFAAVLSQWPLLARGALLTVLLTSASAVLGLAIGVACAWARHDGPSLLRWLAATYVELIRNTPFIVQLFFIFFGLPALGVKLSPVTASLLAMVINLGAYATEIVRGGLLATPRGQLEAAASLALSRAQTFIYVVLPPALKRTWPATVSQIIIVMLGSAVCGQIAADELSYYANLIQSRNFRAFEAYMVATAIYLLLAIALRQLLMWAGPRFLFGQSGRAAARA
jgi:polar amino acid transport system permease protein